MKIASLEAIPLRIPFTAGGRSDAAVWGKADLQTADSLIVKVTTDTGVVGWGESFGFTAIPAVKVVIDSILAPEMIGRDAALIEKLMLDQQKKFHVFGRSGAFLFGLSAIDIALWDIAGRAAGQPVHQLLGGSDAVSLAAYASLIRYSDLELVRKNVRRALDSGFQHLKLHEIDFDCICAAREEAGDDVEIMLDVNCPWSVREALDMTARLRPLRPRWIEEPVWPPENYAALGGPAAMVEWRYFDLEAQLYGDAIIPKNGTMAVPQAPGLGLEPNADVIREYRLR
ncbi:L-alanine-DL-glutamate epimerase-like enolase superfamily enzyme [Paraburkholderia sp. GAS41]|uniref:mandelate racemase/muconate lactonizing enzyme family protein n=1 Tax=Paraburkholderia sp. GAS41 TaxID=3035134 RepID=UPI003D1AED88